MTDYQAPIGDIRFLFQHVLDFEKIAGLPAYGEATPDLVDAILEEAARYFSEVIGPTNRAADLEGAHLDGNRVKTAPALDGIYQGYTEAGWCGLSGDPAYGGQGLPHLLGFVVDEMLQSANMAFSLLPMLSQGVVTALTRFGSDSQKDFYLPRLISGEWAGTMNLTEPQAGSDLAAVRTRAVPSGDHYLLSGQKIFITWGDHEYTDNIIHLVLARTPDAPAGTKGISLFIVPKYLCDEHGNPGERNDVFPVGVEHKLGIHASPTCALSFGDNGGAVGYLVGEENQGLKYMFAMMNHARLAVGLQGVAVSERAYQQALAYARDRVQGHAVGVDGRATIIHHPDVRRMLLLMKTQTEAGRALAYSALAHYDHGSHGNDREYHLRRVDLLTPLVKGWCTEMANEVTSLGVQVHGGMGYIEETGAAQHMRDARILAIYEGTNGIQALDLVGRKLLADKGRAASELLEDFVRVVSACRDTRLDDLADDLQAALGRCQEAVEYLFGQAPSDPGFAGAVAFDMLMLLGTTSAAALLCKGAAAAQTLLEKDPGRSEEYQAKIHSARFFNGYVLSRTLGYLAAIKSDTDSLGAIR